MTTLTPPLPTSTSPTTLIIQKPFQNYPFLFWKHRRLKPKPKHITTPRLSINSNLHFSDFLTFLPPAAALGFTSALLLSLSSKPKPKQQPSSSNYGEWVLFTSPTPFNRFTILRCPSITLTSGTSLSEKLIQEERHFVKVDSGRISFNSEEREWSGDVAEYQRECVRMEDGGVVAIDWPEELDLYEERGLDTTVVIVPGSVEGSGEREVRGFVKECLKRGVFPVVVNPRGCAGSPVTTARLFTAADSDDIRSAIQYITKARPWSALTAVGWGYGANILTKYLAEAGEKTPLTAATCIDNPFDLDEATRTSPYNSAIDEKLLGGLVDILKSNKELFQGRRKAFDLEKGLSADSVRDFEEAISMVSYGFDTLEDFYSKSSTRSVVAKLKIPVLFIQNDNGAVPLFSIPRGLIAENPFTSLLLCSCQPPNITAVSWYQKVTIEWLTAVELGLLKGRHPLLQDIDVTINPSKGLALAEGRTTDTDGRFENVLNLDESDSDLYLDNIKDMLGKGTFATSIPVNSNQVSERRVNGDEQIWSDSNGRFLQRSSVDADANKNAVNDSAESDRGQVLQTAQVVMKMLDVTMPGTLKEEARRKVLSAVGQGETVVKALQDAVPEDVRGKLTSSVSEILQSRGKNLHFDELLRMNKIKSLSLGLESNKESKESKIPDVKTENDDNSADKKVSENDKREVKGTNKADAEKFTGQVGGGPPQEASVSDIESNSINGHGSGLAEGSIDSINSDDKLNGDLSAKKKVEEQFDNAGESSVTTPKDVGATNSEEAGLGVNGRFPDIQRNQPDVGESNIPGCIESSHHLSNDQNESSAPADTRPSDVSESPSSRNSDGQILEKVDNDSNSKEEKLGQPMPGPEQNKASDAKGPNLNVTQALDALSGLDDSTQMAVNNMFGVIEEMITQLEERQNDGTATEGSEKYVNETDSFIDKTSIGSEHQVEKSMDGDDQADASPQTEETVKGRNDVSDPEIDAIDAGNKQNSRTEDLIVSKLVGANASRSLKVKEIPSHLTTNRHGAMFYHDDLRKYILSEMQKAKRSNLNSTTAVFLGYSPEGGQWLLLEQPGSLNTSTANGRKDKMEHGTPLPEKNNLADVIEPSYVVLESDKKEVDVELELPEKSVEKLVNEYKSNISVKTAILNSLKVEVSRKLSAEDTKEIDAELAADMEDIAHAVYLAIQDDKDQNTFHFDVEAQNGHGNHIVDAISVAVQNTRRLKRLLPVGVIVGSSLAALRNLFDVAAFPDTGGSRALDIGQVYELELKPETQHLVEAIQQPTDRRHYGDISSDDRSLNDSQVYEEEVEPKVQKLQTGVQQPKDSGFCDVISQGNSEREAETCNSNSFYDRAEEKAQSKTSLVVGAVTAALGASALLTSHQEGFVESGSAEPSVSPSNERITREETFMVEEASDDRNQSNIVTSLAEKAMSVAAPVVPTKENGEVDQDRLVAMLAEFGQKGGVLKLVGKLALLWGGLRGAMSLTDRLISFLRISQQPLLQRVLGFFCMVIVLWSPVLVPFMPTIFHNWATHNSSKIIELPCILGLYTAITILIVQWGKRIREHENPLKQYGLDLKSTEKIQDFFTGLVGGVVLVMSIQSINALLGFVSISWPSTLSSLHLIAKIKAHWQLFTIVCQGIITATGISFVEELLFRSWLLEEIAADFGYHIGIILSGLVFSLSQRSLQAIPGLWLLAICLAGARLRNQGSLFIPIGLRTGIIASSYVLQMGGFLVYQPKFRSWIAGTHPFQPFSGVVGVLFALLLALVLYPRKTSPRKKISRTIRA